MKRIILVFVLMITTTLAFVALSRKSKTNTLTLSMAIIPTEDALEQLRHLSSWLDYLEKCADVNIEARVTDDYSGAIQALRYRHADIAWLGPFSYILASQVADIEPIAGGIRKDTGKPTYNSIIVTRSDSGINSIKDLKGKTFAFVDPASTSGYLVPMAMFKERGIDPSVFFSNVVFAGSHTAAELAVYNGQVDAAADSLPSYRRMIAEGRISENAMKILWVSEAIPPSPIVVHRDLPEHVKHRLQLCIVNGDMEVISFEGSLIGFVIVRDEDYDVIRHVASELGLYGENEKKTSN